MMEESIWEMAIRVVIDDGGREAAGFKGSAGDCVTRAIAIATREDSFGTTPGAHYKAIYDEITRRNRLTGSKVTARRGANRQKVYDPFLKELGFTWVPCMARGTGCTVHLRASELPDDGILIARLSKHLTCVINGVAYDTFDPSRGGTRCVYGYYMKGI